MSPAREDRFASVGDLARAMLPFASARTWRVLAREFEEGGTASSPARVTQDEAPREAGTGNPVTVSRAPGPARRKPGWAWLAGAVVVAAGVLAMASRLVHRESSAPPTAAVAADVAAPPATTAASAVADLAPAGAPSAKVLPVASTFQSAAPAASAAPPAPRTPRARADAGARTSPRRYELGDQGAPIVE
jgi:hypothetical protein